MFEHQQLAQRIRQSALITGNFTLRSGVQSNVYFDKYRFESDPVLLKDIATAMLPLIPADTDVLAGLELGGIPLVSVFSQVSGLPAAFLRKAPKSYGTGRYAEGASLTDRRFVLVEDIVSSGGALLAAMAQLRADGLHPLAALCVIEREGEGRAQLQAQGLPLHALLPYAHILATQSKEKIL